MAKNFKVGDTLTLKREWWIESSLYLAAGTKFEITSIDSDGSMKIAATQGIFKVRMCVNPKYESTQMNFEEFDNDGQS